MGERRKRKSLWDKEAETKSFPGTNENNNWTGKDQHSSQDSELYHEISASGSHGAPKFRHHPGQPSLESIEKDTVAHMNGSFTKSRENAPEGKEIGSGNSYYRNMPPDFKHNQSLENDRSHSRRHKVRGRSRSRSETRGRCHSRSLSRGRERERERARGRSRSRSRSESDARGRTESQYSGWSDRRSQHKKSTEICSDFSAGRCRRGSQCKYLHSKDTSHRDGGLGGEDTSESWRSRASHGNNSKQFYGRGPRADLKGDFSDPYAEVEQFQNKSKNAPPCKNFVIGKCRWGDTCRFSHHFASDEPSVEGNKHLFPDKGTKHQPCSNRKLLCKYFAAGKCDWDNCRFSHEDSKSNSLVGALGGHGKVIDENRSHDQGNKRNGLIRDDQGSIIDNYSTGHDNRWSHSLGNENISWGLPQQTDNFVDKSKESVCRAGSGSYGGDLGTTECVNKENTTAKQELLIHHGSQLQNQDENMNVEGQSNLQVVDQTVFVNACPVSPVSHNQQQNHGVVEDTSFHPENVDKVKGLKNATGPVHPGQNMHQNGENVLPGSSCISGESGSEQMPALKGAEMHQITNLNLQYLIQKHQNAIQMTGMPEMNSSQSFPSLAISEHSAQYTSAPLSNALQQVDPVKNPVMFPNQRFENEHSGKNAVIEVSNSTRIAISISNTSGHVPLNTVNTQFNPIEASHEPITSMENGRSENKDGHQLAEDNNRPAEPLPPTSIVGMGPNNKEADHSGSSKLQQETPAINPEIDQVKRGTAEERKGVQNSMHAETLDNHGKGDEIIAEDDKDIRLFKNSLIEFVKDILKPTWKEGRMSREVHKTIVKKVVDKITGLCGPLSKARLLKYFIFFVLVNVKLACHSYEVFSFAVVWLRTNFCILERLECIGTAQPL